MEKAKKSGTERSGRDKRKRRSGQQQQHQHHPWDEEEVSLPGAGNGGGAESSNILEVLGKPNINLEAQQKDTEKALNAQQQIEEKEKSSTNETKTTVINSIASIVNEAKDLVNKIDDINCDAAINSIELKQEPSTNETLVNELNCLAGTGADEIKNVLEVESHLIENLNENQPTEQQQVQECIDISELTPTEEELKAIEQVEAIFSEATNVPVESVEPAKVLTTATTTALDQDQQVNIPLEIREAAEDLVNHIESKALEVISKKNTDDERQEKTESLNSNSADNDNKIDDPVTTTLSQRVDEQLSEVTSILKKTSPSNHIGNAIGNGLTTPACDQIKVVDVPSPKTPSEAEERKLFIDSLPHFSTNDTDNEAQQLAIACKREYYQSLKKYLIQSTADKPKVPLQTYRWEDLRRAKERGGYPWTHLYKRPLGPHEEPEIVLLLRKSQELRFASESPKSLKKVRIDDQVLIKETERYIQELSEEEEDEDEEHSHHEHEHLHHSADESESHSLHSESISCISDSVLATGKSRKPYLRLANIRAIIKRRRSARSNEDAQSLPGTLERPDQKDRKRPKVPKIQLHPTEGSPQLLSGEQSPHKTPSCYPIMKKLKSMADRQKKRLQIKRVPLKKEERIVLDDEPKILKLKNSPKSERSEIPHFIEKQDSDDILEIVQLDESPSRKRKDDGYAEDEEAATTSSMAINTSIVVPDEVIEINATPEPTIETTPADPNATTSEAPPKKAPRLRREHVYEEITEAERPVEVPVEIGPSVAALKESLQRQDATTLQDIETRPIPLDRMGSSEEETLPGSIDKPKTSSLAPLSSIDSASSDEDHKRPQLSPVSEESDAASAEYQLNESEIPHVVEESEQPELKSSIKKESSPAPSDKKVVTFSHVEDEAEPHREDIELPEHVLEASAAHKKAKETNDHEYEPIGVPPSETAAKDPLLSGVESKLTAEANEMKQAENLQRDLEERYFSSEATTPRTESRITDYEIHTSQVDSSALEELPLKPENRKKSFMASAQDRTRRMQAGFKNQAGKIKTKLRSSNTSPKKAPSGSPKAKERRRFKAPEFSKMKMPDIKRPDMSKLKDFKRPEFTKFSKPDMSKFKLPEKFSTLKLQRSKSLKENEPPAEGAEAAAAATTPEGGEPHKKLFDVNFGTFPRAFRKKKKPVEPPMESSFGTGTGTGPSVITSTDTQPSFESSSSPQGDRGPGPVRSRWADKFSDVSYNDSEGSRYRRYGSEQESFDRESSLERRMKEDLEQTDTGSEAPELGILGNAPQSKQFAEFDEENRAIHEISSLRAGEFKRRPMVHQDSDLRSEDSRDAVGWTDKEVQKIKLLRKAELEAEASYLKFPGEEGLAHDSQSTASSGKKVVMEEIDDDEFFLRKRGVSEDNIELRQYISDAIREGYDIPVNALEHVGQARQPIEYGDYDVPPPKPRRLHKSYRPQDVSQEFSSQKSDYGDDLSMSQNGSDFFSAPRRPLRKARSRSKYSMESQDMPLPSIEIKDEHIRHETYFDDDEEYLRPPKHRSNGYTDGMNDLDFADKSTTAHEDEENLPQAPRRRKRHLRESSVEKDSLLNSLSGRSVSNNYLQPTEDVIVYRTEHEYYKPPLATPENYTDGGSTPSHKSRFDDENTADVTDSREPELSFRLKYYDDEDLEAEAEIEAKSNSQDKFVIDMVENDGYAVVRKEQLPKPTPPARRKKFPRAAGDRFPTLRGTPPPPERPPPPRGYTISTHSMELQQKDEDDYEEPGILDMERPESPRDLHSGEVINKMKYRPLPPPPRPPREKRQRNDSKRSAAEYDDKEFESSVDHLDVHDIKRMPTFSSDESYGINDEETSEDAANLQEVEVSTQTDPLPDDFVCEEFEITDDMRIITPRVRSSPKTLDDLLKDDQAASPTGSIHMTEDEQLARGLQKFRDANQRSLSEKSRASSQADRSKSLSRPQTPSAVIIERRVSTPVPSYHENETMLEAALIVRPIDDLDLEEAELRREGLLSDESQQSKSDLEDNNIRDAVEEEVFKLTSHEYSRPPDPIELDAAVDNLRFMDDKSEEEAIHEEDITETAVTSERTLRDYGYSEDDEDAKRYSNDYEEDQIVSDHKEEDLLPKMDKRLDQAIEDIIERHIRGEYTSDEQEFEQEEMPPPQPPPRRKSTVGIEPAPAVAIVEEQLLSKEVTPVQAIDSPKQQLPSHIGDLEVERLRVRALQAGQIMVSQLHGGQISAEELECKSGNLVVKSLELPPGFIEDIVDRVRSTERGPLLTTETQTSLQASRELLAIDQTDSAQSMVPPPKPPRQKELEATERFRNHDEETQTDPGQPPVYATTQYLESLVPLIRKDLEGRREGTAQNADNQPADAPHKSQHRHHHHHRHHHYRRCSSSNSDLDDNLKEFDSDGNYRRHHSRSRSRTRPPSECPSQSVSQAGKQFISACSLSLVNIIDQLTTAVRDNDANKGQEAAPAAGNRLRQVPTLVVLFIVILFGILIFLLTGRTVHTHHWDFFNPPGNEGRPS